MYRKFVRNLSFLIFVNIIIKPVWILGVDRSIQNSIGPENYGLYYTLFSISFIATVFLDFGITNFNNRNISRHPQLIHKYFSNILFLKVFLTIAYFSITLIWAWISGYDSNAVGILLLLCANQTLSTFLLFLRSNISALQFFKTDSIFSALDKFIAILICGAFLLIPSLQPFVNIYLLILSQTIGLIISTIAASIIVGKHAKFNLKITDYKFLIIIVKESLPFLVLMLLMSIYSKIDTFILERSLADGAFQVGLYAMGYRLLEAGNLIAFLFSSLLFPIFSKMIKENEPTENLVKLSMSLLVMPSVIISTFCFFNRTEIMELLYTQASGDVPLIFGIIILTFVASASNYIFGTLLTAAGKMGLLIKISVVMVILNIALNLILIPDLGAVGAAYSTLITQFSIAIAQFFFARKLFVFQFSLPKIISSISFIILISALFYFFKMQSVNYFLSFVFGFIIMMIFAFFTGLFPIKKIVRTFQKEI